MLLIFRLVQTSSMNIGPGFGIQKDSAKFSFILISSTRIIKLYTFNFFAVEDCFLI